MMMNRKKTNAPAAQATICHIYRDTLGSESSSVFLGVGLTELAYFNDVSVGFASLEGFEICLSVSNVDVTLVVGFIGLIVAVDVAVQFEEHEFPFAHLVDMVVDGDIVGVTLLFSNKARESQKSSH